MKRRFRLRKSKDFERVRRLGKSYAHPFVILIALPNQSDLSRFGIAAGRSLGGAVERNRAKRLLREALRRSLPNVVPGWDILILARRPLARATFQETQEALRDLLERAGLLVRRT